MGASSKWFAQLIKTEDEIDQSLGAIFWVATPTLRSTRSRFTEKKDFSTS